MVLHKSSSHAQHWNHSVQEKVIRIIGLATIAALICNDGGRVGSSTGVSGKACGAAGPTSGDPGELLTASLSLTSALNASSVDSLTQSNGRLQLLLV